MAKKPTKKDITNIKLKDNYFKNVKKSVGYAIKDVLKTEYLPDAFERMDQAKSANKYLKENFTGVDQTLRSYNMRMKNTQTYKEVQKGFKNISSDLKSGKFYNKDRVDSVRNQIETDFMNKGADDLFMDDSNMDDMFSGNDDDMFGDDGSFDASTFNSKDNKKNNVVNQIDNRKNIRLQNIYTSKDTSGLDVSLTKITMDNDNRNNNIISNLFMKHTESTLSSVETVNENVGSLVSFNNDAMKPFMETTTQFYEDNINSLKGINDTLSQTFELIKKVSTLEDSNNSSHDSNFEKVFGSGSSFDGDAYKNVFKGNLDNIMGNEMGLPIDIDSLMQMKEMLADMGGIKEAMSNPIGSLMKMGVNKAISGTAKSNLLGINDLFRDLPGFLNKKLLNMKKNGSWIGNLFGVEHEAKGSINTHKEKADLKKISPFNNQDHITLTKVIPKYLSEIAHNTSKDNSERMYYNYLKGTWATEKDIKKSSSKKLKRRTSDNTDKINNHIENILDVYNNNSNTKNKIGIDDKKKTTESLSTLLTMVADKNLDLSSFADDSKLMKSLETKLGSNNLKNVIQIINQSAEYNEKIYSELENAINNIKDTREKYMSEFEDDMDFSGSGMIINSGKDAEKFFNKNSYKKTKDTNASFNKNRLVGSNLAYNYESRHDNKYKLQEIKNNIESVNHELKNEKKSSKRNQLQAKKRQLQKSYDNAKKGNSLDSDSNSIFEFQNGITREIKDGLTRLVSGENSAYNIGSDDYNQLISHLDNDDFLNLWLRDNKTINDKHKKFTDKNAKKKSVDGLRAYSGGSFMPRMSKGGSQKISNTQHPVIPGQKTVEAITGEGSKNKLSPDAEISQATVDANGNPILNVYNPNQTRSILSGGRKLHGFSKGGSATVDDDVDANFTKDGKKLPPFFSNMKEAVADPIVNILGNIRDGFKELFGKFKDSKLYKETIGPIVDKIKGKLGKKGKEVGNQMLGDMNEAVKKITNNKLDFKKSQKKEKGLLPFIKNKFNELVVPKIDGLGRTLFGDDEKYKDFKDKFKTQSDKIFKPFKEVGGTKVLAGAGIGAISSLFLPYGPLGGALIGGGISLIKNSKSLNNFLFGDGTDENPGKMPKFLQRVIKEKIPSMKFEIGAGLIGSMFLPGGPIIGGLLGGLGGHLFKKNKDTFKTILFGDYDRKNKTGRMGLLQKIGNSIGRHIAAPFAKWGLKAGSTIFKLLDHSILMPFKKIGFWGKAIGNHLKRRIGGVFEKTFLRGIGNAKNWFSKHITDPIKNVGKKAIGGIFKGIGGLLKGGLGLIAGKKNKDTGLRKGGLLSKPANLLTYGKDKIKKSMFMSGDWDEEAYQKMISKQKLGKGSLSEWYDNKTAKLGSKINSFSDTLNQDYKYQNGKNVEDQRVAKQYNAKMKEYRNLKLKELTDKNKELYLEAREKLKGDAKYKGLEGKILLERDAMASTSSGAKANRQEYEKMVKTFSDVLKNSMGIVGPDGKLRATDNKSQDDLVKQNRETTQKMLKNSDDSLKETKTISSILEKINTNISNIDISSPSMQTASSGGSFMPRMFAGGSLGVDGKKGESYLDSVAESEKKKKLENDDRQTTALEKISKGFGTVKDKAKNSSLLDMVKGSLSALTLGLFPMVGKIFKAGKTIFKSIKNGFKIIKNIGKSIGSIGKVLGTGGKLATASAGMGVIASAKDIGGTIKDIKSGEFDAGDFVTGQGDYTTNGKANAYDVAGDLFRRNGLVSTTSKVVTNRKRIGKAITDKTGITRAKNKLSKVNKNTGKVINKVGQKVNSKALRSAGASIQMNGGVTGSIAKKAKSVASVVKDSDSVGKIMKAIEKVLKNPVVAKTIGKFGPKILSFCKGQLVKVAGKVGKGSLKKLIPGLNIAFLVSDFVTGVTDARKIFKVSKQTDINAGMRIACGVARLLSGFTFNLISDSTIANLVYGLVGSKSKKEELKKGQEELKQQAKESEMSLDEYNDKTNKGLFQKIGGGIKKGAKKAKNAVTGVFKKGANSKIGKGAKNVIGKMGDKSKTFIKNAKEHPLETAFKSTIGLPATALAKMLGKTKVGKEIKKKIKKVSEKVGALNSSTLADIANGKNVVTGANLDPGTQAIVNSLTRTQQVILSNGLKSDNSSSSSTTTSSDGTVKKTSSGGSIWNKINKFFGSGNGSWEQVKVMIRIKFHTILKQIVDGQMLLMVVVIWLIKVVDLLQCQW